MLYPLSYEGKRYFSGFFLSIHFPPDSNVSEIVMRHNQKPQPQKPYPDFPLTWHPSGTWCKKIRGKLHYFGADAQATVDKYEQQREDLQAGRTPRVQSNGLTLVALVNKFLTHKKGRIQEGELTLRTLRDYIDTCDHLINAFGRDKPVELLHSEDFETLRKSLLKKRGPVALANEIQRVRTVFKYAFDAELIDKPIRFGTSFKKPSRKRMRKAKHASGGRTFDAAELTKIINAANPTMKAMVLLGINCGFGQTDVASLPVDAINLKSGWVDFPRIKTAIERRIPLWPETVTALREALPVQPDAKDQAHERLAVITKYGHPWVAVTRFLKRSRIKNLHQRQTSKTSNMVSRNWLAPSSLPGPRLWREWRTRSRPPAMQ